MISNQKYIPSYRFPDQLKDTRFEGDVDAIAELFDKRTKPSFRNAEETHYIRFASVRESDPTLDIRHGQLRVQGYTSLVII